MKEERDQTTGLNNSPSDFQQNDENQWCIVVSGSLIATKFIFQLVSRITKEIQIASIYFFEMFACVHLAHDLMSLYLLCNYFFGMISHHMYLEVRRSVALVGSLVSINALLLVVICRMFFHHVALENKGSVALVVAVSTGKRLLTSVRSHVLS